MTVNRGAVYGNGVAGKRCPEYVKGPGHVAARILIQIIGSVIGGAQALPAAVAASFRRGSVPNIIEAILELLTSDRRPIGPIFLSGLYLPKGIIFVKPKASVAVGASNTLVGVVVQIRVGEGRGELVEEIESRRLRKSYDFVVVMDVVAFCLNTIWLTSGELAT